MKALWKIGLGMLLIVALVAFLGCKTEAPPPAPEPAPAPAPAPAPEQPEAVEGEEAPAEGEAVEGEEGTAEEGTGEEAPEAGTEETPAG